MDKQQEQMPQNQEVEYISAFLDEDEEVNESDFDEPTEEHEDDKVADNQQNKPEEEEQPKKKAQRHRKTIEQEIAELDAKRERLMEKKRRQDAHEKIVFGAAAIKVFKIYCHIEKNKGGWEIWKKQLKKAVLQKDNEILERIIKEIEITK